MNEGVASVVKATRVLRAFTPNLPVLSVRQVSARTGIPRSTAHVLCQTLVSVGLLAVSDGGYELGPLVLELGGQVIERTGLVRAAEDTVDRLIRIPEQEVHLGQLTHGWIVYLHRKAGTRRSDMDNRVGQRAPAHLTGCGKAALCWLPFTEVTEHVRRCCEEDGREPPDMAALEHELARGRMDGYVVSRSFQRGRTSVASAIRDASGCPVGGLSVAGPSEIFTAAVMANSRASVVEAAAMISKKILNYTGSWALAGQNAILPTEARRA